ncbi:uncharacterized protein LOC132993215 [Labrus mixtus]|uniref:uncharacterized protein LOC132993215 n=1 Tax=Labrus mixtus TaxID=508554 RepID=UPI0029BFCA7D|nr:uncharacterized protein LOC132993215 [Labrus mixtus]
MKLLFCLLAGCSSYCCADVKEVFASQRETVTLPCPVKSGDVTWKHLTGSHEGKTLVTIQNGEEKITNKNKYGSLADNSLVIKKVEASDYRMYFCNKHQVYLQETADPNTLPDAGNEPKNQGLDFHLEPGQKGVPAGDEAASGDESSDLWKVPVGVLIGAALVLFAVFTLRFCSRRKTETHSNVDKTMEVIYEEIEGVGEQSVRESDVESPYYSSCIRETPNTTTTWTNDHLYSSVNKLRSNGDGRHECVYNLAQDPGSVCEK